MLLNILGQVCYSGIKIIIITLVSLFIYFLAIIASWTFSYKSLEKKCSHLPRPPKCAKTYFPVIVLPSKPGGSETIISDVLSLAGEDGVLPPVIFMGPFIGGRPTTYVTDADALKEIFTNSTTFEKPKFMNGALGALIGYNGLVTTTDPATWRSERKLLTPMFHFSYLKNTVFREMMNEIPTFLNEIKEFQGEFREAISVFGNFTMKMIIKSTFGNKFDYVWMAKHWSICAETWMKRYVFGWQFFGKTLWDRSPFARVFVEKSAEIRKAIRCSLDEYRQIYEKTNQDKAQENTENPAVDKRSDLLAFLYNAQMRNKGSVNEDLIIDECLTFLFAGHDTSANVLMWWAYFIAKNPDIQKRLQEEIDIVAADETIADGADVGEFEVTSETSQLTYLKCTIQETLRLRPPVASLNKMNPEGLDVDGVHVPKGVLLGSAIMFVHLNGKYWKDPTKFNPSRFDESSPDFVQRHPYAYVPFAAGSRGCIGQKFAMQEMLIVTANILRNFTISYDDTKNVQMVTKGILSAQDLYIRFTPRPRKGHELFEESL